MKEEIMKNYSFTVYPTTHKLYMELKEREGFTHDEAINALVKFYNNHKKLAKEKKGE